MMPAQVSLAADLEELEYGDFAFPLLHNVDAAVNSDAAAVCDKLTRQVSSPVLWLQTIENMTANGVGKCIEIGPGKVLTGLVRQISMDVTYTNIENTESLRNTLESQ
jgi:[acyl-carrier-protein] S-malonyltransferase